MLRGLTFSVDRVPHRRVRCPHEGDKLVKLSLIVQDATSIDADLQFVKHFDGVIGGSEAAINRKLRGALPPCSMSLRDPTLRVAVSCGLTWIKFAAVDSWYWGLARLTILAQKTCAERLIMLPDPR